MRRKTGVLQKLKAVFARIPRCATCRTTILTTTHLIRIEEGEGQEEKTYLCASCLREEMQG